MASYKKLFALDPSGAFYEGKGTTGFCLYNVDTKEYKTAFLNAKEFTRMEEFWNGHIDIIDSIVDRDTMIVIEDYLLYAHKAAEQSNSRMETPKLIGVLQHYCWEAGWPYYMQTAGEVKPRWTDEILVRKGIFIPRGRGYALCSEPNKAINKHCKDAVRHVVHYSTFRNK